MQQVAEIIKNQQPDANTTQTSAQELGDSTTKQLPKLWQTALFERFTKIYRQKFSDQFACEEEQKESMQEWGEALADLTGQQIKRGLDECRSQKSWPPSIAEFIELAKGSSSWEHKSGAYKRLQKALPKPVNREIGRQALSNLRGVV